MKAWAIAWNPKHKPGYPRRLVESHGGLSVYTLKSEALKDFNPPWQRVVRVEIKEIK